MGSLYCRSDDILAPTWSLPFGTAVSGFPVTNLGNGKPYEPFKNTSGTATMRATFGGATTLEALSFVVHTLAGVTIAITNGAGLSTTLVVPANTRDGLSVHCYKDLRGLANPSSTQWDVAVSGASLNVQVGEILPIATIRTLSVRWGLVRGVWYPIDEETTELEVPLIYEKGVRGRSYSAQMIKESDRAAMEDLVAANRGRARRFWLVMDDTVNDCMSARLTKRHATSPGFTAKLDAPAIARMTVEVEEVGLGPALSGA